ncbi:MAG: U32 family peptidase [Gammaproteobacteria bacterium]|nr:U32 family peptidase [Gammaproteobacteria bacterium]
MSAPELKLALAPVSYFWPRDVLLDFYAAIAATPIDIVYLGETVCSKRRQMRGEDWLDLARTLRDAGKEVVLSTLTLVEAESELHTLQRLCEQDEFDVEANDIAAVQARQGRPFITGPAINLYNGRSLARFASLGMTRWVMPVELSAQTLADLQAQRPDGLQTEAFAYGRLPLAYSARCFTARAHNLPKDQCEFRCLDYPDGMTLETREDQDFLKLNGIQTQSAQTYNLLPYLDQMRDLNVEVARLSPQSHGMPDIIALFDQVRRGVLSGEEGSQQLARYMSNGACEGYWHGRPGIEAPGQVSSPLPRQQTSAPR